MPHHLETDCLLTPLACPYHELGCTAKVSTVIFFVCPYCYFRQRFKLFVGNNSITAPPVLFSSSGFLNSPGPTISEPGTGYKSCHT